MTMLYHADFDISGSPSPYPTRRRIGCLKFLIMLVVAVLIGMFIALVEWGAR